MTFDERRDRARDEAAQDEQLRREHEAGDRRAAGEAECPYCGEWCAATSLCVCRTVACEACRAGTKFCPDCRVP